MFAPGPEMFENARFFEMARWGGSIRLESQPFGGAGAPPIQYSQSESLIKVEHLVMPVTLVILLQCVPNLVGLQFQVRWGSGGTVTNYLMNPGVHVLFGQSLQVDIPPVQINPALAYEIKAFGSVCFAYPQWDGELADPVVGT